MLNEWSYSMDLPGCGAQVGQRELPKGCLSAFGEVTRRELLTAPSEGYPRERGRPARILILWLVSGPGENDTTFLK